MIPPPGPAEMLMAGSLDRDPGTRGLQDAFPCHCSNSQRLPPPQPGTGLSTCPICVLPRAPQARPDLMATRGVLVLRPRGAQETQGTHQTSGWQPCPPPLGPVHHIEAR